MPKKNPILLLCTLSLVVGFQSCGPTQDQDATATIETYFPQSLTDRSVDLAYFNADEVATYISLDNDRESTGNFEALWTKSDSESETPVYWSAKTPATLTIDLADPSHVSTILVYPFTQQFGVGAFDAELIAPDGTAYPAVKYRADSNQNEKFDAPARALSFELAPRVAGRVRLRFTRGTVEHPERIYLRAVRILGTPPHSSEISIPQGHIPPNMKGVRIDVATFTLEQIQNHVAVSEDKRPNGRYEIPWLKNEDALPDSVQDKEYWSATSPSWVSVNFEERCTIDEVWVTPFDAAHGFASLYLKIVDENGSEYDPTPPATFTSTQNEVNSTSPPETRLKFVPINATGIKIYLSAGEEDKAYTYVRDIKVFGVPASSEYSEYSENSDPED